jgi:hypothetical protein
MTLLPIRVHNTEKIKLKRVGGATVSETESKKTKFSSKRASCWKTMILSRIRTGAEKLGMATHRVRSGHARAGVRNYRHVSRIRPALAFFGQHKV